MPDTDQQQNFEIPQETKPSLGPTVGKKNKLLYALIPMAVFLVILAVAVTLFAGKRVVRPAAVTATPTPEATVPPANTPLSIASTSAFFSYVASVSAMNKYLNTVDLTQENLAPPQLDLHITFDQSKSQ